MLQSSTENILVQDSNLQELHLSAAQSTFDLPKRKKTQGSITGSMPHQSSMMNNSHLE